MYFTKGKDIKYEKMMQEIPGFDNQKQIEQERDCKHCLYHDRKAGCKKSFCVVFEDK